MYMDIQPLLTWNFWLNGTPPPMQPLFEKGFLILFVVSLIGAIVMSKLEKKSESKKEKRLFLKKLRRCATTFGIVGLVWLFFAYERAPYLSMRLWLLLLVVGIGAWKLSIYVWYFRNAPVMAKKRDEAKELGKYIPK